jgi:NADH-quinone oxidoreductase subunit L
MLLASTMAMVDRDLKKIWAYSTISQLGFMIMGLAAGSFFSGLFHLSTHAGFKALLFLCSGIWIHAYATNDIFEIGRRGGRSLKIPMVCIVLAAAALAGLPPLSGFFSKEVILAALAAQGNPIWLIAGLLGVFLTSYYGFRPIFIILFPGQAEDVHHHEQVTGARERFFYWAMAAPLLVLAGITVVLGFFQAPLENGFLGYASTIEHVGGSYVWLLYVTIGLSVCGVGLAWFEFGRKGSSQIGFVEKIQPLRALFAERWYIDHFYQRFVHYIVDGFFSKLSTRHDRQVIDGGIDGLSRSIIGSGRLLAFLQSGVLRYNLVLMFAVLAVVALYFFFS